MIKASLALAAILTAMPASAAAPVAGRWLTDDRDAIVEIGPCGGKVCGRIARILAAPQGPLVDKFNPDASLRSRPILGLVTLFNFTEGKSQWDGRIYDPRRGKTYRSVLTRRPDGNLDVKGCLGPFCKTLVWKPAPKS